MKKVFIAIGAIGLGYGIYQYYMTQGAILYNYKYRIIGVTIKKASLKEVELQIDVEVINDSAISATLSSYYFDIYLNGEQVAVVQNATLDQFLQKNGGTSYFPMKVTIDPAKFLTGNVVSGLLESVKNSTIEQRGYFGFKKGLLRFNKIPFNYTYKVKDFL
jgi:LEA14-like dessication related protein